MARPSGLRPSSLAVPAVLVAAMLFGTAGTAQELGPDGTTSLGVATVRIAGGAVVLWLAIGWAQRRGARLAIVPTLRRHAGIILLTGIGVAMYNPLFMVGVDRTGVAVGTVVAVGSGPFFAGALEWTWRGVRPTRAWFVGTSITVGGGIALVAAQSAADDAAAVEINLAGVAVALAAGFGYALYSVAAKVAIGRGVAPTLSLAAPFAIASVALMVLAVREPFGWLATRDGALMAIELGVAATGIAYLLFGYGLSRLTSATTVSLVLAEPLTATLLAVVVLNESIAVLGWLGIAVLCAGLVIVGRAAE